MKIFVIGATGFVGGGLARSFASGGHEVSGLARTHDGATQLEANGIRAIRGDLTADRTNILAAAVDADAVIYAAQVAPDIETSAVGHLLDALEQSGSTFVFTSGSGVLMQRTGGAWSADSFAEDEPFVVEALAAGRLQVEQLVRGSANSGLRTMVIRPGMIWGPGDHGHVPMIYQSVAHTGACCYVGDGLNVYSNVHIDDVAKLYTAALTHGRSGSLYHAVAGEIPTRWIAESVAVDLGTSARSVTTDQATDIWGEFGALIAGASSRIRATRTRADLPWTPAHTDMLTTIGEPRLRKLAVSPPTKAEH